jgi:hypothetical protein
VLDTLFEIERFRDDSSVYLHWRFPVDAGDKKKYEPKFPHAKGVLSNLSADVTQNLLIKHLPNTEISFGMSLERST